MNNYNNGKIGILVSYGYGTGWSSMGDPKSCMDRELVEAFINKASEREISAIASKNWPEQCQYGLHECEVEWLEAGTPFRINEYDGFETLEVGDAMRIMIAE
jgi:hypothetical protein